MATKRTPADSSRAVSRAAASIGSALTTVASRVDDWLAQREDIAHELNMVVGRAQNMLASLGDDQATEVERRTTKMARKTARTKRRIVSRAAKRSARKNGSR